MLSFQNCGNVSVEMLKAPVEPTIQAKGISGDLCSSPLPVSQVSRYNLDRFLILNLTALSKDAVIETDSNINGVLDRIETNPIDIPTIKISSADTDADGVPDFIEEIRGLTSNRDDLFEDGSDQDAVLNLEELKLGTDPTSRLNPSELNRYSVTNTASVSGCDNSQKSYRFTIENLQRISISSHNDSVNTGVAVLSHDTDENVFLIYAHFQPERVTEPDRKLFKIFKVKKADADFYLDLKASDFSELPAS